MITDLNWFGWVLVVFFVLQTILAVSLVGKEREPFTPTTAIVTFVMNTLFVFGVVFVGVK